MYLTVFNHFLTNKHLGILQYFYYKHGAMNSLLLVFQYARMDTSVSEILCSGIAESKGMELKFCPRDVQEACGTGQRA